MAFVKEWCVKKYLDAIANSVHYWRSCLTYTVCLDMPIWILGFSTLNGPCHEKTCFMVYANKKMQSDQRLCCSLPRQQNTFTCYVQNFNTLAASEAEQAGLSHTWSESPEDSVCSWRHSNVTWTVVFQPMSLFWSQMSVSSKNADNHEWFYIAFIFFNSNGDNFIFTVRTCSSIHLKPHFEFLLCNGKH